jgi:alpha-amylase
MRTVSHGAGGFDMRNLVRNTLAGRSPVQTVTFVDNHDTFRHPEESVADWFKPLAYAFILLREAGYPCVFFGDYFDVPGRGSHRAILDPLLAVRRERAFGPQEDYFDHENVVGWTRLGDAEHPRALAVVMSDAAGGEKEMLVGRPRARFVDATGAVPATVTADANGRGVFACAERSVSVWVEQ